MYGPFVPQWDSFTAATLGTKELKVAVLQRWPLCGSRVGEMTIVSFRGLQRSHIKKLPIFRIQMRNTIKIY